MNIIFYAIIIHWLVKATAYVPRMYDFKKKTKKQKKTMLSQTDSIFFLCLN